MTILTFGTDVQSLRVQRSLNDATSTLSRSFERLSTGLRINSASDDAAGIAIADSLKTNARLYSSSMRNINDGISALNIIDGTLNAQTSILTRLVELSEQSANGTFSEAQRRSLNTEYQALVFEFGRLGDSTKFNNINLLLGGHGSSNPSQLLIQAGITGSSTSTLQVNAADTGTFSGFIHPDEVMANPSGPSTLEQLMNSGNNSGILWRVRDTLGVDHEVYLFITGVTTDPDLRVGAYIRASESNGATSTNPNLWVSTIGGSGILTNSLTGSGVSLDMTIGGFAGGATAAVSIDARGLRVSASTSGLTSPYSDSTSALNFTGVETAGRARVAIDRTKRRLDEISKLKGQFGAIQSRLEIARNVSDISREGSIGAESRIRDVDIASETATLVAAQIRQQTSANILNQIGSRSDILLSLLSNV